MMPSMRPIYPKTSPDCIAVMVLVPMACGRAGQFEAGERSGLCLGNFHAQAEAVRAESLALMSHAKVCKGIYFR
jgi:hypothetical protein